MMMDLLGYGLIALLGIILSAMFSGLETGLYRINRIRLTVRASRGEIQAVRLRDLINNPNRMLSTLLLGNNIANYAGSFGIAALLDHMGYSPGQAVLINASILVPLLFVFGETLPKDLFRTYTDRWSYAFSGFLTWTARIFTWTGLIPIVQSVAALSARLLGTDTSAAMTARQRISQLIAEGVGAGVLSESQTTLADRALAMRDLRVAAEMVPWRRARWLTDQADDETRRAFFRRYNVTRAPVLNARGEAVGVVSVLDIALDAGSPIRQLLSPVVELDPAMRVREALQEMQAQRGAMAVVIKPGTRTPIGLVTFKDLVEPLTGELAAW